MPHVLQEPDRIEAFFSDFDTCFSRSESRARMRDYVRGLLSDASRKNTWQIAEQVGLNIPDGLQRLLYRVPWSADEMCKRLRQKVVNAMGYTPGVGVIDESGFVKKGDHSAGVAAQYCGRVGKVENCQVGVFLGYVSPDGHALLDRELYLPQVWCQDRERSEAAHIPSEISFQTKPQLALHMLRRAWQEGIPLQWVTADTIYGNSSGFRNGIHAENRYYVAGISRNKHVGRRGTDRKQAVASWVKDLPDEQWTRYATRAGEKGLIWSEWARLRVDPGNDEIGEQWLLLRRHPSHRQDYECFLSNAPQACPLETLVMVASARHHIEEALEECKGQAGLADYEVRFWHSWYRHITLALLAYTLLILLQVEHSPEKKNALRQMANLQPC